MPVPDSCITWMKCNAFLEIILKDRRVQVIAMPAATRRPLLMSFLLIYSELSYIIQLRL
jgi:hypothetical protein